MSPLYRRRTGKLPGSLQELLGERLWVVGQLANLLADLEAWHRDAGRPEAAFEARCERLEHLARSVEQEADKLHIRRELERRSCALSEEPRVAMGLGVEMTRDDHRLVLPSYSPHCRRRPARAPARPAPGDARCPT